MKQPPGQICTCNHGAQLRQHFVGFNQLEFSGGMVIEQRRSGDEHQAQRADGAEFRGREDLVHIVQVPEVLTEGAADQAVGLVAMDHHRADRRGVGAHDYLGEIRGDAAQEHEDAILPYGCQQTQAKVKLG